MAVLKSFELNGNKKSFANWISNLSPTSTPFTSMIGKEKIDQTQYSWQTDTLAPATSETFEEGSQATLQPRATTNILTNFTSLVRRAVRVSDTNECTHAYGRRDEMAYQMGKAGQAVLRDVEYMNLSTRLGVAGTSTQASAHSGFKDLCAPLFMPDPDTFALTHQGIAVVDETKPWFAVKDIFKVTTELFLAGSRADKIMFHPKHMNIFSDCIGYNEEEPLIFRLFDNLDTKYNANVSKIKDPVGRVYTLIPNRWMPEGQVYIFSEDDWTQMVLQQPVRKKLSKTGSSSAMYVETEVGLRHKHPHASGVLDLIVVAYKSELSVDKMKMTAFIEDKTDLTFSVQDKAGAAAASISANLYPSNIDSLGFDKIVLMTNASGTDSVELTAINPGKTTLYASSNGNGSTLITNPVTVEVVPPAVEFKVAGKVESMKDQHIDFKVTDAQGNPVPDGTVMYISVDEGLELLGPTSDHVILTGGTGVFGIFPKIVGKLHLRASFVNLPDVWKTPPFELDVVNNDFHLVFDPNIKSVLTHHIDGTQAIAVTLFDGNSTMASEEITFTSLNENVVSFLDSVYTTNTSGIATAHMAIDGIGETQIVATFKNKAASLNIRVGDGSIQLSLDKPKLEIGDFEGANVTAQLIGADGSPARKSGVHIAWNKHPETAKFELEHDSTVTDADGKTSINILAGDVVEKGSIAAYWSDAEEEVDIDFEVIRNQYKLAFNDNNDLFVTGGLGDEIEVSVKVDTTGKPFLSPEDHTLSYSSGNTKILNWTKDTGVTDHSGYVEPANSFHADGFGELSVTVSGEPTDTNEYIPVTKKVISRKPIVSLTVTPAELLVGDTGQMTVVMRDSNNNVISYQGDLLVNVDQGILTTPEKITFTGSKVTFDFTAANLGTATVSFDLPDGTSLDVQGTREIKVVHPGIRISAIPETYSTGETVEIKAILSKPVGSSAELSGKNVVFTIEPDTLNGINSGVVVATDSTGTATLRSGPISGNSDYEIIASFNGTSDVFELTCDN